jgi:hypothetical protein
MPFMHCFIQVEYIHDRVILLLNPVSSFVLKHRLEANNYVGLEPDHYYLQSMP